MNNEENLKWKKTDEISSNNFISQIEQLSKQVIQTKMKSIISKVETLGRMYGKDSSEYRNLQEKLVRMNNETIN
jgi:hypothetical protein